MRVRILPVLCFLAISGLCSLSASAQDKGYDVTYYKAIIRLDRAHDSLDGVVTMTARSQTALTQVLQHAKYLTIDSVVIGQTTLKGPFVADSNGAYFVQVPQVASGSLFMMSTYYHGKGHSEGGSFPWGGVTDSTGMFFAMGVGFSAPYISCTRHWLPCYDLPDDKADSIDLTFIVPDSEVVASNGILADVIPIKEAHAFHWHESRPIASYLITFATAPFQKLEIANSLSLPFEVYAFAKDTLAVRKEMTNYVAPALAFFDSLYGKYPFEKVGFVMAPFGSMEHQTMITLDPSAINASSTTAQHELSHQWWGDRVTCKTFDDAWLNEGFATYSESLVLERFNGIASYWNRQHSNIAGAISGGSAIALFGAPNHTKPRNNYPYAVIYEKGAAFLGMLRYFLGDSLFFHAIRAYGDRHAYSTATSFDLKSDFESATGQDLGWFFNKWVFGTGYPQLKIASHHGANDVSITLTQAQDSTTYGFFRLPLIIEARKNGVKERVPIWLDSTSITQTHVHFSFSPDSIVVDPDGAVIKKILSAQLEIKQLPLLENNLLRVVNNPVRDGELVFQIITQKPNLPGKLSLLNASGTVLREIALDSPSSYRDTKTMVHFEYKINVASLPSGVYFAMLQQREGAFVSVKFVIAH